MVWGYVDLDLRKVKKKKKKKKQVLDLIKNFLQLKTIEGRRNIL